MILNAYWQIMNDIMTEADDSGNKSETVKGTDGNDVSYPIKCNNSGYKMQYFIENTNMKGDVSFRVGTGNTEPAADDYEMANDVTDSLTGTSLTVNHVMGEDGAKVVYTFSASNQTGDSLTISEVGIVKTLKNGESSSPSRGDVLIARDILDTPVTVPSGSGFVLTYEWTEG